MDVSPSVSILRMTGLVLTSQTIGIALSGCWMPSVQSGTLLQIVSDGMAVGISATSKKSNKLSGISG